MGSDDVVYEADRYHSGGEASDFGIRIPITGSKDPELYQTERYAMTGQQLSYTLPMPMEVDGAQTSCAVPVASIRVAAHARVDGAGRGVHPQPEVLGGILQQTEAKGVQP